MTTLHSFQNDRGDTLSAHLELPVDGAPTAYTLFIHSGTWPDESSAAKNISLALTEAGLGVLRLELTANAHHATPGTTNLAHGTQHIIAAAHYLARTRHAPQILIGHALGGTAALIAAHDLPSVRAVATINTPSDTRYTRQLLPREQLEPDPVREVLEPERMQVLVRGLKRALLIMHAPQNNLVSIDSASQLFLAAKHPKSFVTLDRADHLLSNADDSRYAGSVIAAWAGRYVQPHAQPSWKEDVHDNRVASRTEAGLRTEVMANGFPLVADEPVSLGGTNTGPTPYDYLAAALGACTSMTLRMYADRKGWPLKSVTVRVRHSKVHVEDCLDCEKSKAKLDHFERELALEGELSQEQRQRLLEIAERCPVHRTLEAKVRITSRLADRKEASD